MNIDHLKLLDTAQKSGGVSMRTLQIVCGDGTPVQGGSTHLRDVVDALEQRGWVKRYINGLVSTTSKGKAALENKDKELLEMQKAQSQEQERERSLSPIKTPDGRLTGLEIGEQNATKVPAEPSKSKVTSSKKIGSELEHQLAKLRTENERLTKMLKVADERYEAKLVEIEKIEELAEQRLKELTELRKRLDSVTLNMDTVRVVTDGDRIVGFESNPDTAFNGHLEGKIEVQDNGLEDYSIDELLEFRTFGRKAHDIIKQRLNEHGW